MGFWVNILGNTKSAIESDEFDDYRFAVCKDKKERIEPLNWKAKS